MEKNHLNLLKNDLHWTELKTDVHRLRGRSAVKEAGRQGVDTAACGRDITSSSR